MLASHCPGIHTRRPRDGARHSYEVTSKLIFPSRSYMQGIRRPRDGYKVSKCEYDVCEPGREGVTFVVVFRISFWYIKFGIFQDGIK